MKRFFLSSSVLSLGFILAALSVTTFSHARGEQGHGPHEGHDAHGHDAHGHDAHGHDAHGHDAHGDGHGAHGHHVPEFSDINWFHGFLGEKEGVEPGLLYRPKGMPIPLGALILNTAVLFYLIGRMGGPGIRSGLKGRKERIAGEIERAAKMRAEAEEQLAHYEGKLAQMESELVRIKAEMAEQARVQRDKVLSEARQRRTTIEAEARQLIKQELAHARQEATARAVSAAVSAAKEEIQKNLNAQDHERLSQQLLSALSDHVKRRGAPS